MTEVAGPSPGAERSWSPLAFRGLLGRGAFAVHVVVWHVVVGIGAGLVFLFVFVPWLNAAPRSADAVFLGYGAFVFAIYAFGMTTFVVRRLRDLGRPAAWVALGFVPIVNLVLLAVLLVAPGASAERARAAAEVPDDGSGGWSSIASALESHREEAEEREAAAFEEGRRFAERLGRRRSEGDAG